MGWGGVRWDDEWNGMDGVFVEWCRGFLVLFVVFFCWFLLAFGCGVSLSFSNYICFLDMVGLFWIGGRKGSVGWIGFMNTYIYIYTCIYINHIWIYYQPLVFGSWK